MSSSPLDVDLMALGLPAVWLLGLGMGLTTCALTCLPFLGTWTLGRGGGASQALLDTTALLLGRLLGYGLLGAIAGTLGDWLTSALEGGAGHAAAGAASVVAGLWLLRREVRPVSCPGRHLDAGATPPFLVGFSLVLTPCAPLTSLLAIAALAGSPAAGAVHGLAFGLGAAVTPLLLIGPLLGSVGGHLRTQWPGLQRWTRHAAALLLILLGVQRFGALG